MSSLSGSGMSDIFVVTSSGTHDKSPVANSRLEWLMSVIDSRLERGSSKIVFNYTLVEICQGGSPRDAVRNQSMKLLQQVNEHRNLSQSPDRPIVFIGHELGGTIIKDAIAIAALDWDRYKDICALTKLFIFLDSFHRVPYPPIGSDPVAQWLSLVVEPQSPKILASLNLLSAAVIEVNEVFLETKFPQIAKVASICASVDDEGIQSIDEFSGTVGSFDEQIIRLSHGNSNHEASIILNDMIFEASVAAGFEAQNELLQIMNYLSPPVQPIFNKQSVDDHVTGRILQSKEYLDWHKCKGPMAVQLHGPGASDFIHIFNKTREKGPTSKKLLRLHFVFDQHDNRRSSTLPMMTSFITQILSTVAARQKPDMKRLFQQRRFFRAWTVYDAFFVLAWLSDCADILCILENFDQCEPKSRQQFLDNFNQTILLGESQFKLLATSGKPLDQWPGESLSTETFESFVQKTADLCLNEGCGDVYATKTIQGNEANQDDKTKFFEKGKLTLLRRRIGVAVLNIEAAQSRAEELTDLFLALSEDEFRDMLLSQSIGTKHTFPAEKLLDFPNPVNAKSFFASTLDKIPETERSVVAQTMAWVLCAVRPLSVQELAQVVIWTQRREFLNGGSMRKDASLSILSSITDLIWGLIVVKDNEVKVSHPIVREFFGELGTKWYQMGDRGHYQIVLLSLELLQLDEFLNWEEKNKGMECCFEAGDFILPRAMFEDRSTLHQYIIMNWIEHYKRIPLSDRPRSKVKEFLLDERKLYWTAWEETRWVLSNLLTRADQSSTSSPFPFHIFCELGDVPLMESWKESVGIVDSVDIGNALVAAARTGIVDVTELLLSLKFGELQDHHVQDAMVTAASFGHRGVLSSLVSSKVVTPGFLWPTSLLVRMSELGFKECVEVLLRRGCSPDTSADFLNVTPLLRAARNGHADICEMLLEHGADIHASGGDALLMDIVVSCPNGAEVIKVLAKHGIDINVENEFQNSALYRCSEFGHFKVAEALADIFRSMGIKPSNIESCLVRAAQLNRVRTVECLIDILYFGFKRDDVHGDMEKRFAKTIDEAYFETTRAIVRNLAVSKSQSKLGSVDKGCLCNITNPAISNLSLEQTSGSDDLSSEQEVLFADMIKTKQAAYARFLGECCAKINEVDESGFSPLMFAASAGDIETVRYLLDNGADVNQKDEHGESALFDAAEKYYFEIVDVLLEYGADASGQGFNGRSVLELCVSCPSSMRKVLKSCPESNIKNNQGLAPIHFAAVSENVDAIKVLVDFTADLENEASEDYENHTPLIMAVINDDLNVVQSLLDAGANVNHRTKQLGCTAFHHAKSPEMTATLLQYLTEFKMDHVDGKGDFIV